MKRHLANVLEKPTFTITLLALFLTVVFTFCTMEEPIIPDNSTDQPLETLINKPDEATTRGDANPEYWKKYIQKIVTEQQFDCFEIVNTSGELLHQWAAAELEIDDRSPIVLVLKSENQNVHIAWGDIVSIVSTTNQTVTEQVMCKAE